MPFDDSPPRSRGYDAPSPTPSSFSIALPDLPVDKDDLLGVEFTGKMLRKEGSNWDLRG